MATLIPLKDASRQPVHYPYVTLGLVLANSFVFILELMGGQPFVQQWSAIPANITSGQGWITVVTALFMHGGWLHIIGNMVFLWAFGREIEDTMNPARYLIFYLVGGVLSMLAQIMADPHSTIPNLGASGAIAAVMGAFVVTYPRDKIKTLVVIFFFASVTMIFRAGPADDRRLVPDAALQRWPGGQRANRRRGLHGPRGRIHLRRRHRPSF